MTTCSTYTSNFFLCSSLLGFDFIFNRSNISFPPNSTEESCLEIIVINDTLTEGTESFSLQITVLSPPDIATPGNPSTVNILDNDSKYLIVCIN